MLVPQLKLLDIDVNTPGEVGEVNEAIASFLRGVPNRIERIPARLVPIQRGSKTLLFLLYYVEGRDHA